MLLRKLECYGFKSFAERIEVEFGPGITTVVGPNGSGKSNITDAIRWVLGEQSAKNLRGAKMEDVIFNGSDRRKPLGLAEVSLTLDNSDNTLSLDFNEVTITRRVYRSGESEYLINKVPCRLKDIHDLLSDTGLGKEAIAVIGQNKVDEILNNRPEDRRTVFEEAAGITKYKNRKKDALRKLSETDNNLLRLSDILHEIELQLAPLSTSAAKAQVYQQLSEQLAQTEITYIANASDRAELKLQVAQETYRDFTAKQAGIAAQLATLEMEQEKNNLLVTKVEQDYEQQETSLYNIASELERLDGKKGVLEERLGNLEQQKNRNQQDITSFEQNIADTQQLIAQQGQQQKDLATQQSNTETQINAVQNTINSYLATLDSYQNQNESDKAEELERVRQITTHRNIIQSLTNEFEYMQKQSTKLDLEVENTNILFSQTKKKAIAAEIQMAHYTQQLNALETALALQRETKRQWNVKREKLGIEEKNTNHSVQALRTKLRFLLEMQKEYEGFGKGVKSVLTITNQEWRKGIYGVVADLIQVPSQYIIAIETALAGAIQHIIAYDADTAKKAISYLKQNHSGRATFLPLDTIRPSKVRENELQAVSLPGAIGFAVDLVKFDRKFHPVMSFLLGRIIIAQNIDAAVEIAKKTGYSTRIVTLEGDVVNAGGSLTGGMQNKKDFGLLSRKNEIGTLEKSLGDETERLAKLTEAIQKLNDNIQQYESMIASHEAEKQELQVKQVGVQKEVQQYLSEKERFEQRIGVLQQEQLQLSETLDNIQQQREQAEQALENLEVGDTTFRQRIEQNQAKIAEIHDKLSQTQQSINEYKISQATLLHEVHTCKRELNRLTTELALLKQNLAAKIDETTYLSQKKDEMLLELNHIANIRLEFLSQKQTIELQVSELRSKKYSFLQQNAKLEKFLKDIRRQNHALQQKTHESELELTRYQIELDNLISQLNENYDLSLEEARQRVLATSISQEELELSITELKQQIQALGTVNLGAIEEYENQLQRHTFLHEQQHDLTQAKQSLFLVIQEMDGIMEKQFQEAFSSIKEHFRDIFKKLFGGGNADLILNSSESVLDAGVEIIAQPPGKKLQSLTLLSGGERALTVIALLFAILTYRPAPFCVVDEIDAPLDEANVQRFADFLQELSRDSQFIVVTHRKGTMEASDVMHGVTMEEFGISKLISVQMSEKQHIVA